MTALIKRLLIFSVAVALLLEISLRIYYFGTDGLIPSRLNSYTVILDSGLVQPAQNTDLYYELKPGLDLLFHGKRMVTNSEGLADNEYSVAKPDNTYRVVVVGSSWSMATGVAMPDSYQALLEQRLQATFPERQNEVINFAVEYYGLGEITAVTQQKVTQYEPDLILVAITSVTPLIRWENDKQPFTPTSITPPAWQSYLYSEVAAQLGYQAYAKSRRPRILGQGEAYFKNIARSLDVIADLTADKDIDVKILWLTHTRYDQASNDAAKAIAGEHGFDVIQLHLDDLAESKDINRGFLTGRVGRHPNELGHQLIADEIYRYIWGQD